jgi:C1A family cysteine protease
MDENIHNSIAWCVHQNLPVAMAFGVYSSFNTIDSSGVCPVPAPQTYNDYNDPVDPFYGGHEVAIVGYDDEKKLYTVANSWGANWGDKGFFYMPYEYVENFNIVFDFCVVYCL